MKEELITLVAAILFSAYKADAELSVVPTKTGKWCNHYDEIIYRDCNACWCIRGVPFCTGIDCNRVPKQNWTSALIQLRPKRMVMKASASFAMFLALCGMLGLRLVAKASFSIATGCVYNIFVPCIGKK